MKQENKDKEIPEQDEIERKFLLPILPPQITLGILNGKYKVEEIEQGYLPNSGGRFRKVTLKSGEESYFYTEKTDVPDTSGISKKEKTHSITRREYEKYVGKKEGELIQKTRYYVPIDNLVLEINMFHGRLEGRVLGEIEFATYKDATDFKPLEWIGRDVTEEVSNRSLALGADIPRE
jgi:adenylate cyclase